MGIPLGAAFAAAFAAAVFFWGRGIVRARRADLIAGAATLVATCAVVLFTSTSSAGLGLIGALVGGFGVALLIISPFAPERCPLARRGRLALAAAAILAGLFLQVIV